MKFLHFLRRIAVAVVLGCAVTWLVWPLVEPQPRSVFTFPGVVRKFCQFHPDGKWLVIETFSRMPEVPEYDNIWRFVNVETGHQGVVLRLDDEGWLNPPIAVMEPDGSLVLIEERFREDGNGERVLAVRSGQRSSEFPDEFRGYLSSCTLSPDGKWFVIPPHDPSLVRTSIALADQTESPKVARGIPSENEPITPEPPSRGEVWVIDHSVGDLHLGDRMKIECGAWLDGQWYDSQIAFSVDGNLMAVAIPCLKVRSERDDFIQVWDLNEKKLLHTLTGCDGVVDAVWFDADGQSLCVTVSSNDELNKPPSDDSFAQTEVRYDWKSGHRMSVSKIKHATLDRADGWQLIQRNTESNSFAPQQNPIEVLAPGGKRMCSLPAGSFTQLPTVCRFAPGTNLIERSWYQEQDLLMTIWQRYPWLSPLMERFIHDDHRGNLEIVDRRNGASVWSSSWGYKEQGHDCDAGGNWHMEPHPHAVSRDGKLLAEGTCDGYSTTFRFWDLPQHHWPARFANGLGLLVAAAYCSLRRGRPSQTSNLSEVASPAIVPSEQHQNLS